MERVRASEPIPKGAAVEVDGRGDVIESRDGLRSAALAGGYPVDHDEHVARGFFRDVLDETPGTPGHPDYAPTPTDWDAAPDAES